MDVRTPDIAEMPVDPDSRMSTSSNTSCPRQYENAAEDAATGTLRLSGERFFGLRKAFAGITVDRLTGADVPPLPGAAGIVRRIWDWHAGCHPLPPISQLCQEIRFPSGFCLGKILLLTEILRKVIEFHIARSIEVFDQFPIPFPDRPCRPVVVKVRVMPV